MSEYRRQLAYAAGRKAALEGKPETANNRERGTIFYDDWGDGWSDGDRARAKANAP
jgi:hypothetical protein